MGTDGRLCNTKLQMKSTALERLNVGVAGCAPDTSRGAHGSAQVVSHSSPTIGGMVISALERYGTACTIYAQIVQMLWARRNSTGILVDHQIEVLAQVVCRDGL
jgi:hypothetical protein